MAIRAVANGNRELLARLNEPTIKLVFDPDQRSAPESAGALSVLLDAVWNAEPGQRISPLVLGARLARGLTEEQLITLRQGLAKLSDDNLEPLFRDPPAVRLISGEVSSLVFRVLSGWDPVGSTHERVVKLAGWMRRVSQADWAGNDEARPKLDDSLRELAAATNPKVADLTEEPSSLEALDAICRLIGTSQAVAAEIDQFGESLASRGWVGDHDLFRSALALPVQSAALASTGNHLATAIASSPPERMRIVLEAARGRVEEALPNYRDQLLDRWATTGEAGFARLALYDPAPNDIHRLEARWEAVDPQTILDRAIDVLELQADHGVEDSAQSAFVARIADRIRDKNPGRQVPPTAMKSVAPLLQALKRYRLQRASVADAITDSAATLGTAESVRAAIPHLMAAADELGTSQRSRLADALTGPVVAHSITEPAWSLWLVEWGSESSGVGDVLTQLIGAGRNLDETLRAFIAARKRNHTSPYVFPTLMARASREQQPESAAKNLEEAAHWPVPSDPSSIQAAEADLLETETKHPSISKQVEATRKRLHQAGQG